MYPNSQVFALLTSDCVVCCKLKHSLFCFVFLSSFFPGEGIRKTLSFAMQLATNKSIFYIFTLVQLLKCKTFPVIP